MKRLVLGLVLAVALVACETLSPKQIAFNTWAGACTGYNNMLITLSPSIADGSMSDDGVAIVDEAMVLVGPFCLNGVALSNSSGSTTEQIQAILLKMEGL